MLGSVPRWPCGYIQRPYLLLRFLVLLSLSLSSSLSLFCLPPFCLAFLLFLSRHAFDMRISKYTHASSRNVLLSDDPLFLPATSCFDIFTRRGVRFPWFFSFRASWEAIMVSALPENHDSIDSVWSSLRNYENFFYENLSSFQGSAERWEIRFESIFIVMIVCSLRGKII